ncbi:MAG: Flp family type IVb pilin [Bacillota bacterium]|nr:Flp family type IVb pilin [Bacillota bacterium]
MISYLRSRIACLFRSQRGAATAEYALLLALVVIVLIGVLTELGAVLVERIQEIVVQLGGA